MSRKAAKLVVGLSVLMIGLVLTDFTRAQETGSTLSGTVTASSGVVANAKVSLKNVATQQSMETQTDVSGRYNLPDLAAGDYELSISAQPR
jgi:hypothetical protein